MPVVSCVLFSFVIMEMQIRSDFSEKRVLFTGEEVPGGFTLIKSMKAEHINHPQGFMQIQFRPNIDWVYIGSVKLTGSFWTIGSAWRVSK
jgi:hypothetical protein